MLKRLIFSTGKALKERLKVVAAGGLSIACSLLLVELLLDLVPRESPGPLTRLSARPLDKRQTQKAPRRSIAGTAAPAPASKLHKKSTPLFLPPKQTPESLGPVTDVPAPAANPFDLIPPLTLPPPNRTADAPVLLSRWFATPAPGVAERSPGPQPPRARPSPRAPANVAVGTCPLDTLLSSSCVAAPGSYVTTNAGTNVNTATNPSATTTVSAAIPDGFYQGQSVTLTDPELSSSNIRQGVEIFGVTGSLVAPAGACADDALNAAACATAAGRYVTSALGADVLTYTNPTASTTITSAIPRGFYDARSVSLTEPNLVPANIRAGEEVFGVTGTLSVASAVTMLESTITTNGTGVANCTGPSCPIGYSSLGCASAGNGGPTNSGNLHNTTRSQALTNAIVNNFTQSCSGTFASANQYNKVTCLRICVQ